MGMYDLLVIKGTTHTEAHITNFLMREDDGK